MHSFKSRMARILTFAAAWSLGCFAAESSGAGWSVSLGKVKITPDKPVFMSGYASRDHPSEGVLQDLWVKVLALRDLQGTRAVLLTSDLIGFRPEVSQSICERLVRELGIERSQILLTSTHTHGGPALAAESKITGKLSPVDADRVREYSAWLSDRVVECVKQAWKAEPRPANLSYGTGVVNFVMNRREVTDKSIRLGVNPRGLADRSVPVLKVAAPDGTMLAVVFQAGAHNTTLGGTMYQIHGDYAGWAQAFVEERYPGVQAMFVLGCAGDTNPYPRGTVEHAQAHGKELGTEVARLLDGKGLQAVRGPLKTVFCRVDLPLRVLGGEEIEGLMAKGEGSWQKFVGESTKEMLERGVKPPSHFSAPLALWQFGEDLTLVGLSGEVTVEYVALIEQVLRRENRLWIAAYCNEVFGYVVSKRILAEGGYETRGLYTAVGLLDPSVEDVVVRGVAGLARQAGRAPGPVFRP